MTSSFVFIDILALFPEFHAADAVAVRDPRLPLLRKGVGVGLALPRSLGARKPSPYKQLLDFLTVIEGRNHRQGLQMKTEEDFPA